MPQMEQCALLWPLLGWICVQKSRWSRCSFLPVTRVVEGLEPGHSSARDALSSAPQIGEGVDDWAPCCFRTWPPWNWSSFDLPMLSRMSRPGASIRSSQLLTSGRSKSDGTGRGVALPLLSAGLSVGSGETWLISFGWFVLMLGTWTAGWWWSAWVVWFSSKAKLTDLWTCASWHVSLFSIRCKASDMLAFWLYTSSDSVSADVSSVSWLSVRSVRNVDSTCFVSGSLAECCLMAALTRIIEID